MLVVVAPADGDHGSRKLPPAPAADAPGSVDVTVAPENSDPCTVLNGYMYY